MELSGIKQLDSAIKNKLHNKGTITERANSADIEILRALSTVFDITLNKACDVVS